MFYFDHSASTPLHPQVLELMQSVQSEVYGNPSSVHSQGRQARSIIEKARKQIASAIKSDPSQIIFTSGGTEANNQVFWSRLTSNRNHVITDSIEHPAVSNVLKNLEKLGLSHSVVSVDKTGMVSPQDIDKVIHPNTGLISVMLANNEVGTIQLISEIVALAKSHQILVHTDAVQCLGKIPIDVKNLNVDFLSLSAHKFYGPKGIGILYVKDKETISSLLIGGSQESGLRAGTENIASIAGMGLAAELCSTSLENHISDLKSFEAQFKNGLGEFFPNAIYHGHPEKKLPGLVSVSFPGNRSDILMAKLDRAKMAVSSGSACGSGNVKPSLVLKALGLDDETNICTLRVSFGHTNTPEQIDSLLKELKTILAT